MTEKLSASESAPPPESPSDQPRRGFLASVLAGTLGVLVGLVPLVTGTLFFLDPLFRRKKAEAGEDGENDGFTKVRLTLDQLKESQVPVQVPIISSKVDKWTRYPEQPIGSVYLRIADDGETVQAFNVTCPHLGCAVEFRVAPADQKAEFYCPCHTSAFELSGEKKNKIPPRDLDALDVKVVKNDKGESEIWVKYQEFRATLGEKVPV